MYRTFTLPELNIKRGSFKRQLTEFQKYVDDIADKPLSSLIISNLSNKLQRLKTKFDQFDEIQAEIELKASDVEKEREIKFEIETQFDELVSIAESQINNLKDDLLSTTNKLESQIQSVKLPTIELPSFDGNFMHWLSFKDSFTALIHDRKDLSDVQKLIYLRSSLKGDAFNSINSLETTNSNYLVAFNIIQEKYSNTRRIVYKHVDNLLNLKCNELKSYVTTIEQNICCLNTLNVNPDSWDPILVPLLTSKLEKRIIQDWDLHVNSIVNQTEFPSTQQLLKFLSDRSDIYQTVISKQVIQKPKIQTNVLTSTVNTNTNVNCILCNTNHMIFYCKKFLQKNVNDRIKLIKTAKACFNCLKIGHFTNNCKATKCKLCNAAHNTLLHTNQENVTKEKELLKQTNDVANKDNVVNCVSTFAANHETLLATAEVFITDKNGKMHKVRALLDPAATSNFVTEDLVRRLNLKTHENTFGVNAFNKGSVTLNSCTTVNVSSMHSNYQFTLPCIISPNITTKLPRVSFDTSNLQIPKDISLADKKFNQSRDVDLLINATMSWQLFLDQRTVINKNVQLHNTKLGWVVSGDVPLNKRQTMGELVMTTVSLNEQLEKFWKVDEYNNNNSNYTSDDLKCEEHFSNTTFRDNTGRFVVSIPFKDNFKLGNSKQKAVQRFLSLERRLQREPHVKEMYNNFMLEYQELGHMTKVNSNSEDNIGYFLPHHHIIREESTTTKLRVVFDGSQKTDLGQSLNDVQYAGPTIQTELFSILLRFRKYAFIATADIKQMYRQILIREDQRCFQKIVWRADPKEQLTTFQLNTVTYGTKSAPYLAIRCLHELADQNRLHYPSESECIKNDFYVDDLLTGHDDINILNKRCTNIRNILSSAGFSLHKWTSNARLFDSDNYQAKEYITINNDSVTKTLGITYQPQSDTFHYNFNGSLKLSKLTKRTVLSATAQNFDPLGILSPITIIPKIIVQRLWKLNIDWDQEIPKDIRDMWQQFEQTLHTVSNISVPRHVINHSNVRLELHGFADASEKAYGACIYVKNIMTNSIQVHLLTAKSRVAPVKSISLPRLELCAAVLLAELLDRVRNILSVNFNDVYLWSDSTITLAWIKGSPSRWHTFVANRVSKIQSITDANQWHHVKSKENPSDLISRGVKPENLVNCKLWWNGPQWLASNSIILSDDVDFSNVKIPEQKMSEIVLVNSLDLDLLSRFSNINTLINVVGYCIRFANNCKNKSKTVGILSPAEREKALHVLIKISQQQSFAKEIKALSQNLSVPNTSNILSLSPFVDNEGLLRVGGRLRNSAFSFDQKHQIILPKDHKLTTLIAKYKHDVNLHCSQLHLLNILRQKYWPISGKSLTKKIIYNCVKCFKAKPRTYTEIMGDLPTLRVQPAPPFYNCGVDYAGPFFTRDRRARGYKKYKSYVCLFVCFSTKAIHLELVSDLTSEAFLSSLRRFIARRGVPHSIHSDNGTTFVGANTELQNLTKLINQQSDAIISKLANEGKSINWHFIPPKSPHFGGLWESNVKLVKSHLTRVIGINILTFEEFYTILTQVEAIVNSRPISPLSNDPNDFLPLTPSHFLIGRPLTSIPDADLTKLPETRLSTFQRMQQSVQHFWKRWKRDYVHCLQTRQRWKSSGNNALKEGYLVLLVEDNEPPYTWRMGRIVKLWPGKDNKTRVVTVRTSKSELKRSVNKICVLPMNEDVSK